MHTPTEAERAAFVWMQGRMVELLLRHHPPHFERAFGEWQADPTHLDDSYLRRVRDLAVLFYLRDELFGSILPRIKRRLSFAAPRETQREELPTRGRIDWPRTAAASWRETPDEPPLEVITRQRRRHFATPENLLVVATLLEYRHAAQGWLDDEAAQDGANAVRHPLPKPTATPAPITRNLSYDAENRLVAMSESGGSMPAMSMAYDGDGKRVRLTEGDVTTLYVGNHFEYRISATAHTPTRYYYAGAQRIALRVGSATPEWLVGDHLGSTSVTLASNGTLKAELRYKPWGQTRYESGTTATQRRYTGQIQDAGSGLYFYNARYYDPAMGKFIQADTIVPEAGNPQAFNRYAYTYNNPIKYTDPSGHCPAPSKDSGNVICVDWYIPTSYISLFGFGEGDGRGYDTDSDPQLSRAYLYIHLDDNGKVLSGTAYINPSCTAAGCYGPYIEYNKIGLKQSENGDIHISWSLQNGAAGALKTEAKKHYQNSTLPGGADSSGAGAILDASSNLLAAISGSMTLAYDKKEDRYRVKSMDRDPYPALQIDYYEDGKHKYNIDRFSGWTTGWGSSIYGPHVGLTPLAPNEKR
ncbi:MAG: hypothetical protein H0T73_14190 [Ardenticatenales bacterium]|nr:hypothetical protein [Ardenticatenales bacterium]